MTRPSAETVGMYWQDEAGVVWLQITYTDQPTAAFRRVDDQTQRLSGVVTSQLFSAMRILKPEEEPK